MRKKLPLIITLILLVGLLTGCTSYNEPINSNSTGIWNEWFVWPLSQFITYIANIFGGSYGMAIIICTIIVRLVLLPLMIKQTKSSGNMQLIQPEIKKLREKYSSKDQETQKKLQQETMKLFQEHNVNPVAGCLPLLIQMPILIAFYHAINRTPEIKEHTFLWFQMGAHDPYYILPVIAAVTTFISQKIMMGSMGNSNPQMAMMTYIMPIMILVLAINFPAALALYWVIGNIFMIFQTYFVIAPMRKKYNNQTQTGGTKK
ncbi:YidC/Oxa1 family membrane protein insertase [Pullulanibacillus pueri]|uniref:Membrane protein insertase YidC n=1 Tax=Pullulanibacillus pueri TaxID=1437324 RepID=A0A8J3ELW9_9BACL|nr:YidC family membrane integrase SpoIIIJ [Pullulanibacillus pueri]MBM7682169.1 YidC/Oxa1 family membrane protein insertase [Pullulanibacillus pueri]GGH80302.1 membrane protein insertase YidC [Pullulanibacillus pueri]